MLDNSDDITQIYAPDEAGLFSEVASEMPKGFLASDEQK